MAGVEKKPNKTLNVGTNRILKSEPGNLKHHSEEYQILDLENCIDFKQGQVKLASTLLENFPNIFVIVLNVGKYNNEEDEKFLSFMTKKIPKNRDFFVQTNFVESNEWQVHYKEKNAEKFIKFKLSKNKEEFLSRYVSNKKLETINFFEVLNFLNCSLVDVDFNSYFDLLRLSSPDDKFSLIKNAIQDKDELLVKLLMLFVPKLNNKLLDEVLNAKNVNILILILNNFAFYDVSEEQVKKILTHALFNELLVEIACQNNFKILKILMKNPQNFKQSLNYETWCKAKNKAFDNNFHTFCRELQLFEEKFYGENIKDLHESIKKGQFDEVKQFVEKFPEFKFCILNEKCAIQIAVEAKKFYIKSFLQSKDFLVFNEEFVQAFIYKLSTDERDSIIKTNLIFLKNYPNEFISILVTKIKIFAGAEQFSYAEIHEMLNKLKEKEENQWLMKIAAQVDFTIVIDFVNKSTQSMNPRTNENTYGVTISSEKLVYLGKNISKMHCYGTFLHELMHLVLRLIYENYALPHCKNDKDRENEWLNIVQQLKNKSAVTEMDVIIKRVFKRNEKEVVLEEKKELAVRVNQILAVYFGNEEKIDELRGLYPELFRYMREKVLADLKIPNVYRMIKLNNDFGLIQKIEASKLQVKLTEKSEILNLITADRKNILIVTNVPQLMLSKIFQEIKNLPSNKLNLKARNIFVDGKALEQKHVKEEFDKLIETTNIDRIVANFSDLETLSDNLKPDISCLLVASEGNESNFKNIIINIQWQDLCVKTQDFLLNKTIKFQEGTLKVNEILSIAENLITPEILTVLCSESEIRVNCESKLEKVEKFIERTVQMKVKGVEKSGDEPEFKEFSLEDFLTETEKVPILVISDVAGSGKTTLLRKIHENLMPKFPQHFIIFISLLKYVDELSKDVGESFTEFIAKILNFDALEKEIFMQKYSKGEVKILFDAFDEISPKCKENTTKLFQLFKENGKNQAFITTRTHLEEDLENDLNVLAHRIKVLTVEEQIQFVEEFWEHKDRVFVKNCAKLLVAKIAKIIGWNPSLIGVPLVLKGLAEAYKDQIDEDFEGKIQNLDISSIYKEIIDTSLNILSSKFPQIPVENQTKLTSPLQIHLILAICLIFSEEFASFFNLNHDEDEWPFEEIARCGLIIYDNGKFHFNHQTYAEYLVALFIFHLLKTVKKLLPAQLDLIYQVLTEKGFQVVRMFLNSMLNEVEKVQSLKSFNSSREICEKIKNKETKQNFLHQSVGEKLFNIFEFFALVIKKGDIKLFKEMIEYKDKNRYGFDTSLMQILPHATNLAKYKDFLDEIFNFYSEDIFDDFLLKVHEYNRTILHHFAIHCKNTKVFECFWNKIKDFSNDEVKKFLLMKDYCF